MLLVRTNVNELYKNTEYLSTIWKETDPRGHREFDMDWNMAFEAESKGVLHSWLVLKDEVVVGVMIYSLARSFLCLGKKDFRSVVTFLERKHRRLFPQVMEELEEQANILGASLIAVTLKSNNSKTLLDKHYLANETLYLKEV